MEKEKDLNDELELEEETTEEENKTNEDNSEELKRQLAEAQEEKSKRESRFKSMAKKYNNKKEDPSFDVNEIIEKKLAESEFYNSDPVAKEFKNEIKEVQTKYEGMSPSDAFTLWKATNKPELLAKKQNEGIDGIESSGKGTVTDAELLKMSDADFMKNFR